MIRGLVPLTADKALSFGMFLAVISPYVAAHAQSGAAHDAATLIQLWEKENEKCRGGHGDDPRTDAACAARQTYDAKLPAIGWCFAYHGIATVDWHPCGSRDKQ